METTATLLLPASDLLSVLPKLPIGMVHLAAIVVINLVIGTQPPRLGIRLFVAQHLRLSFAVNPAEEYAVSPHPIARSAADHLLETSHYLAARAFLLMAEKQFVK